MKFYYRILREFSHNITKCYKVYACCKCCTHNFFSFGCEKKKKKDCALKEALRCIKREKKNEECHVPREKKILKCSTIVEKEKKSILFVDVSVCLFVWNTWILNCSILKGWCHTYHTCIHTRRKSNVFVNVRQCLGINYSTTMESKIISDIFGEKFPLETNPNTKFEKTTEKKRGKKERERESKHETNKPTSKQSSPLMRKFLVFFFNSKLLNRSVGHSDCFCRIEWNKKMYFYSFLKRHNLCVWKFQFKMLMVLFRRIFIDWSKTKMVFYCVACTIV